jgi:hypothetical protein
MKKRAADVLELTRENFEMVKTFAILGFVALVLSAKGGSAIREQLDRMSRVSALLDGPELPPVPGEGEQ